MTKMPDLFYMFIVYYLLRPVDPDEQNYLHIYRYIISHLLDKTLLPIKEV